jgi:hypothetical protein
MAKAADKSTTTRDQPNTHAASARECAVPWSLDKDRGEPQRVNRANTQCAGPSY